MTPRRWTVVVVPHGASSSKSVSISTTVLKLVAGAAIAIGATALAAALTVVSHGVDVTRSRQHAR